MTPPILPVLIIGPAILTWNGYSYYAKMGGLTADFKRTTFNITSDTDGIIDERQKSQRTEISFSPVGMMNSLTALFPYPISQVGASIFGPTPLPLVIKTKFGGASNTGQTITYPRAAISKTPQLRLKPSDTMFGDVTFTALGNPTVEPNTAGAWQTIVDAAFSDTSFDEKQIVTDSYAAAWGSAPFNSMGSMEGFMIDLPLELSEIMADDYGLVDIILRSVTAKASFSPSNLTESQIYTLLNNQGSGYIFPGQSLSNAGNNLVLTGSGNGAHTLTATIYNAGPKDGGFTYSTDKQRLRMVDFTSKRTWTAGAANPLYLLATT